MASFDCLFRKGQRSSSQSLSSGQTGQAKSGLSVARAFAVEYEAPQLPCSPPRESYLAERFGLDAFCDDDAGEGRSRWKCGSAASSFASSRNSSRSPASSPARRPFGAYAPQPDEPGRALSPRAHELFAQGTGLPTPTLQPSPPRASSPLAGPSSYKASTPPMAMPIPIPKPAHGPGSSHKSRRGPHNETLPVSGALLSQRPATSDKSRCSSVNDNYASGYASDGTDLERGSPGTDHFQFQL